MQGLQRLPALRRAEAFRRSLRALEQLRAPDVIATLALVLLLAGELGYNYRLVNLMAEAGTKEQLDVVSSFGKWAAAFGFALFLTQLRRRYVQFRRRLDEDTVGATLALLFAGTLVMRAVIGILFWMLPYLIEERTKHDAVSIVQIRESGSKGAWKHPDLWRSGAQPTDLAERIARSNLAFLLIEDGWRRLHGHAQREVSAFLTQQSQSDIDRLVYEIEQHAAPFREPYQAYKQANDAAVEKLEACRSRVDAEVSKVKNGDKVALQRHIQKLPPPERKAALSEQNHVYHRHGKTTIRGRDLPLFMSHAEFTAYWSPHVERYAQGNHRKLSAAQRKVAREFGTYQRSMDRLRTQLAKAQNDGYRTCQEQVSAAFAKHPENAKHRLAMNLTPEAFIVATTPDAERANALRHLGRTIDPARPELKLRALHVKDLPILENESAVRTALDGRIRAAEREMFKAPSAYSDEEVNDFTMAIIGRPLALVLSTLSLLLNLGGALGSLLVLLLKARLGGEHPTLRLARPATGLLLLLTLLALDSPFRPNGEFHRLHTELGQGSLGLPGRAWALALQAEPIVWTLGKAVCANADWVCPDA